MSRRDTPPGARAAGRIAAAGALLALAAACDGGGGDAPGTRTLRVGHFPNVTHAHGLVAHGGTRAGKGWYEERLGPGVKIEWFVCNAGPSAMEGILTGALDMTYVGPNPAINAHIRSEGQEVRVVAGATYGGAALVVQGDGRIAKPADFRGKRVATPQFGNTQDVACRAWLVAQGFKVTQTGGDVTVIPTENPDQLALFRTGDLDAAWTVEPWVSRLEQEAGGKVFLSEDDAVTTVLVAGTRLFREDRALLRRFAEAHAGLTAWIREHPGEARAAVRAELEAETGRPIAADLVDRCWRRMRFDAAVTPASFTGFLDAARAAGFLGQGTDLSRLVETP